MNDFIIHDGILLKYIGGSKKTLKIPTGVHTIRAGAFDRATNSSKPEIDKIILPKGVKSIEDKVFSHMNISDINFPESLTFIGESAFNHNNLKDITIRKNMEISDRAFRFLPSLKTLKIVGCPSTLGIEVFADCESLTTVDLTKSNLEHIPDGTFDGCVSLTEIGLPMTLKSIGKEAFRYTQIHNMTLPEGLETIGIGAFSQTIMSPHSVLKIPNSVTDIERYAFFEMRGCRTVILPDNLQVIRDSLFKDSDLKYITFGNNIREIDDYAFSGSDIYNIVLPEGLNRIGYMAFSNTKNLNYVNIPEDCILDNGIFYSSAIPMIRFPLSCTTIPPMTCYDCNKLVQVEIPETCHTIDAEAFYGTTSLKKVHIPDSVKMISSRAFEYSDISLITGCNGVSLLGEQSFSYCTYLTKLPELKKLKSVEKFALYGSPIEKFIVYENVAYIDSNFSSNPTELTFKTSDNKLEFVDSRSKLQYMDSIDLTKTNLMDSRDHIQCAEFVYSSYRNTNGILKIRRSTKGSLTISNVLRDSIVGNIWISKRVHVDIDFLYSHCCHDKCKVYLEHEYVKYLEGNELENVFLGTSEGCFDTLMNI